MYKTLMVKNHYQPQVVSVPDFWLPSTAIISTTPLKTNVTAGYPTPASKYGHCWYVTGKIKGWNLQITHEKKGKWSEPNLHN